jgi:hypothetical protein
MPNTWSLAELPKRTSDIAFEKANAYRKSDLSAKRNLGLLLARLHGWRKIVFLDDDIKPVGRRDLARIAGQLDEHQMAGMMIKWFPDNSVVCHARRQAKLWQDVFVSGAVLGVRCDDRPLSFFPDIYNEDWFFFAEEAAGRQLPCAGRAKQTEYDPFASPNRARWEEFGDLLAEGLYACFGRGDLGLKFSDRLTKATRTYWSYFIESRQKVINDTQTELDRLFDRSPCNTDILSAIKSLAAAETQLDSITADLCVDFLAAWQEDLDKWRRFSNCLGRVGNTSEAMDFAQLETWTLINSGNSKSVLVGSDALTANGVSPQQDADADLLDLSAPLINAGACPVGTEAALAGSEI